MNTFAVTLWTFLLPTGVADQLQTNYASDLRHILKTVFDCASTPIEEDEEEEEDIGKEEKAKECDEDVGLSDDSSDSEEDFIEEEGNQNPHNNTSDEQGMFTSHFKFQMCTLSVQN